MHNADFFVEFSESVRQSYSFLEIPIPVTPGRYGALGCMVCFVANCSKADRNLKISLTISVGSGNLLKVFFCQALYYLFLTPCIEDIVVFILYFHGD